MNKDGKIKKILDELLEIDHSLGQYQEELGKILNELVLAKPDVPFDENFKNELKRELQEKIVAKKVQKNSIWSVMSLGKKLAISGSFIAVLAIVLGMTYLAGPQSKRNHFPFSDKAQVPEMTAQQQITQREETAFGELKANSTSPGQSAKERLGAGGMEAIAPVPVPDVAVDSGDETAVSPAYVPKRFVFSYRGENIRINQEKSEVLRRIKDVSLADLGNLISSFDGSLVDFGSFSNLQLQSLSLAEDRPYGLFVNFSAEDGSVSINQNWKRWNMDCHNGGCPPRENLKPEDIPADPILISVADEFIQRHGINVANFEKGQVDPQWNSFLMELNDKANRYIPDELSVIYPLKVGERKIYNQSGSREGLRVQVNIRLMRASGMYGLTTQKYESSFYQTETDFLRLVQIAENGGSSYPMPLNEPAIYPEGYREELVELELATPTYVYLKYWHYDGNETQELIVPALAFPVQKAKQSGYYQDNIVVPLIKDLLEQN